MASAHDLQPSLYGAFILPDSEEGQEQKCAECFEQLMKLHLQDKRKNWGAVARKEPWRVMNRLKPTPGFVQQGGRQSQHANVDCPCHTHCSGFVRVERRRGSLHSSMT